ncbi:MAG TPA: PqqD family protein [Thermodesulfobacteriota bacterium]|nr:PqqD family protein [Thermodesulfobacteriota bacterium]
MSADKPLRKESVREELLSDELMLYDPGTDSVHILNGSAKTIWRMSDGGHTIGEMEERLRREFSVGKERDVRGDIEKVITELSEKGMLE